MRRILVAGISGASLGTEIIKCLVKARKYEVFGCDSSELAYGHFMAGIRDTFLVPRSGFAAAVRQLCIDNEVQAVIPGGEAPLTLILEEASAFQAAGICIAANSVELVRLCSDKANLLRRISELGIPMPWTLEIAPDADLRRIPEYPIILKPATGTGGSAYTYLAANEDEARAYAALIRSTGREPIAQEYLDLQGGGEFTVGVLSVPSEEILGSVVMQRHFGARISVASQTSSGLISSGISQGRIAEFPGIQSQSESIAAALRSCGPLNIQGRLKEGRLLPFEVNARFSGSCFLRAMAGFNEVESFLDFVLDGISPPSPAVTPGYYLRSLTETYVADEEFGRWSRG